MPQAHIALGLEQSLAAVGERRRLRLLCRQHG
jgi:hypothetical protein